MSAVVFMTELRKPVEGARCNGCGYCCASSACWIAAQYLGASEGASCPALESVDGGSRCGMVANPITYLARRHARWRVLDAAVVAQQNAELGGHIAHALAVGEGCDSLDDVDSARWPWKVQLPAVVNLKGAHD